MHCSANTAAVQRITVNQTTSDSADLHNLHVDEAMAVLESAPVTFQLNRACFLDQITGCGWHSRSSILFSFINDGAVRVYF